MNIFEILRGIETIDGREVNVSYEETINWAKMMAIYITGSGVRTTNGSNQENLVFPSSRLKRFDQNNGIVAFTDECGEWVIPDINVGGNDLVCALENQGYHKGLWVPFSNGEIPTDFSDSWQYLLGIQKMQMKLGDQELFKKYCQESGIKELQEDFLREFFLELPAQGLEYESFGRRDTYYPPYVSRFGDDIKKYIARFCTNNGICFVVDSKGRSFVAPLSGNVTRAMLEEHGYREAEMFVPLSNGEQICSQWYADRWNELNRKASR